MNNHQCIGAIILAAGYSSRMGAFKPLLPLGGSTVLEESVTRFRKAGVHNLEVVVGYRAEAIIPVLERLRVGWVRNEDYDRGMFSSVLTGVRRLASTAEAFFLLPVDIPLVKPRTIRALLSAFRTLDSRLVYPCFNGQRGHPPIISVSCLAQEFGSDYPGGLRAFLRRYEAVAQNVSVADQAVLMDCDTPEDYEKLLHYARREAIPTEREAEALLLEHEVPERVLAHSRMVSRVAHLLGMAVNRSGGDLNVELIIAGGLLHDLAKGQPDHALAAGRILSAMECPEVARVVASHMDIDYRRGELDEAALVYLADKLVDGTRLVSFEERFRKGMRRFADSPEIVQAIQTRRQQARTIQEDVEATVGESLELLLQRFEQYLQTASPGTGRDIYLVRHGAVQMEGGAKRFLGQLDVPLSNEGRAQVERLRETLGQTPFATIWCSDLRRSLETAELLSTGRPPGSEPRQCPELREIALGEWDGLTFDEVKERYPAAFEQRGRDIVNFRPPGGESFADCAKRVIPAFYRLLQTTHGNLLVVGHAGVNRIILCRALGLSLVRLFEIGQDYACLNLLHWEKDVLTAELVNGRRL